MTAIATAPTPDAVRTADTPQGVRDARRLMRKAYAGTPESAPYRKRFARLQGIRQAIEPVWLDVQRYLLPALGRYLDSNNADPGSDDYLVNHSRILDSSPTKMAVTAADGLHGGLTNQAEQWFSLYTGNYGDDADETSDEAREWVERAQNCERDVMAASNFYTAIYAFYLEVIGFGTAFMLPLRDPDSFVRYYTHTAGSYWLDQDQRGRIDTAYLKFPARAVDIVAEYGEENCPARVAECLRRGSADKRFWIIQCIQPWNFFGREPESRLGFTYEDVRYVAGGSEDEKILSRGGYRTKPFVAVRWSDSGGSVYARSCPGIDALPDIKQLQEMTLDYNKAIKWRSDPAFAVAVDGIDSVLPGQVYKVTGNPRDNLLTPIVVADYDINANQQAAQQVRERISAFLYNREILLVQSRTQHQLTATEVNQLVQEKNTVLGPIVARMGDNALIPCLDRTFELITGEWNLLPPPPPEIEGRQIKPYFTGELAKAQRQGGIISQMNQAIQIAGGLASLDPTGQILANFDWGAMLRDADEVDLFPPGTIRSKSKVEELQAQQQQAMAQQQKLAGMQQAAELAKTAGQASVAPDTLLGQMAGQGMEGEA